MSADDLPDQLSLAAHGMRELMERLPLAFDVPIHEKSRVLDRVSEVERDLSRAQERSSCRTSDGWQGPIDAPVAKLLATVERLVEDRHQYWPSRAEVAVELMNQLEPALGRRSPALVKPEAATWAKIRRYFEQVSHHHHLFDSFETNLGDLEERIQTVEVMLLWTSLRRRSRPKGGPHGQETQGARALVEREGGDRAALRHGGAGPGHSSRRMIGPTSSARLHTS
jgi:hypothetical protein